MEVVPHCEDELTFGMSTLRRLLRLQRMLDWPQRRVHLRLLAEQALGKRRWQSAVRATRVRKILFVCHGNIMRSAFAEAYCRKVINGTPQTTLIATASAGIFATPGRPADPRTIEAGDEYGLDLRGHKSQQISRRHVDDADLICVMDHFNEVVCVSRFPDAKHKTVLLGSLSRGVGELEEIDDPFVIGADSARIVFHRVARAVEALCAIVHPGSSQSFP
jgi:protein-tyrosine-phosphatase